MRNPFKKKIDEPVEPLAIIDLLKTPGGGTRFAFLNVADEETYDDAESRAATALSLQPEQVDLEEVQQEAAIEEEANGTATAPSLHHTVPASQSVVSSHKDIDLYRVEVIKKKLAKDQAKIFRGDGTLFATLKGQKVHFEASGADVSRRDILYHRGLTGSRRFFEVAGEEYHFVDSSKYRDKCLLFPSRARSKKAKPLAVFELWPVSRTHRGQIRIYEPQDDTDTMIELDEEGNITPTRLLDVSIIAYVCLLSFKWNESLIQALQDPRRN